MTDFPHHADALAGSADPGLGGVRPDGDDGLRSRASFLHGDTMVSFERPNDRVAVPYKAQKHRLCDLHARWNAGKDMARRGRDNRSILLDNRERVSAMKLRVFDEDARQFEIGHITDLRYDGLKPVYRLRLQNQRSLVCAADQEVLTADGWQTVRNAIGLLSVPGRLPIMTQPAVMLCNGMPVYRDRAWLAARREQAMSVEEMAAIAQCSNRTIHDWLRRHGMALPRPAAGEKRGASWNKDQEQWRQRPIPKLTVRESFVTGIERVGEKATFGLSVGGLHRNFVANGLLVPG